MKTTLISLSAILIMVFAVSYNSPASVNFSTTDNIVYVDDTTQVSKANAKDCDHPSVKSNCKTMTPEECKAKCESSKVKCSKAEIKACCSKGKKK